MADSTRSVDTLVHGIEQQRTSPGGVWVPWGGLGTLGGLWQRQGCSSGAGRAPVPSPVAVGAAPASRRLQQ